MSPVCLSCAHRSSGEPRPTSEVVGCSKEGTHILNFLVLDCTAPIEEQLELDCTGTWGLPVETAEGDVLRMDEVFLVI